MASSEDATSEHGDQRAPVVFLLTGLPGTGKTTFATALAETSDVVRLSVDEAVFARHGRYDVDYPADEHLDRVKPVEEDVRRQLVELVESGRSVVLDHGLGRRSERDAYKRLIEQHGGTWRLVHFSVDPDELQGRLELRNRRADVGTVPISAGTLSFIADQSEAPVDEGAERPEDVRWPSRDH